MSVVSSAFNAVDKNKGKFFFFFFFFIYLYELIDPFSAKPIFNRRKTKSSLGTFTAALVFMLER